MDSFNILKKKFNNDFPILLKKYINNEPIFEQIMYALNNGKRLRPILVLSIEYSKFKINENQPFKCLKLALAIELIHTSSLLLDDLPSMDNDEIRRNQPSFHKKYSEFNTQIISCLMIMTALKLFKENITDLKKDNLYSIFNDLMINNIGINGLIGGQVIDITPLNEFKNEIDIHKLFKMKTTSLFEIAILGSYLLNFNNIENISKLKESVNCFGLAFQIYDDFDDIIQDEKRNNQLINPNYIHNYGKSKANKVFFENINNFIELFKQLNLFNNTIIEICYLLINKVKSL